MGEVEHMPEQAAEERLELGGNIELSGFTGLMPGSMTIIKKLVGTYTKRYTELKPDFERLQLTMKPIHQTTDNPKIFHIDARMIHSGKVVASDTENRNIFHAIDSSLKKIESEIDK
jgi:ribosome-associated translation inhibitor RaiA